MKRRNFLGFLGGAAVAGPGMAKAAAAKAVEDLALGGGIGMPASFGGGLGPGPSGFVGQSASGAISQIVRAQNMLEKIAGMTAAERTKRKQQMHVGALDPDLAAYRSMSIGARMDMQRERNLERYIAERRGMWEIFADGRDPYEDQPI